MGNGMPVHLIQVPYDSGHRAKRMGRGPLHLVEHGALTAVGTSLIPVEIASAFPTEIGTAFELHRAVAGAVADATRSGALPVVLSGNCNRASARCRACKAYLPTRPLA